MTGLSTRAMGAALACASLLAAAEPGWADPAVCTWGGTAVAPTGAFTIGPGLSNRHPAAGSLDFTATGDLAGPGARCSGTMQLVGQFLPGSFCRLFLIGGRVEGVPGVAWFFDAGGAYSNSTTGRGTSPAHTGRA